jgi:uncharacterized protein (DUF2147 family)
VRATRSGALTVVRQTLAVCILHAAVLSAQSEPARLGLWLAGDAQGARRAVVELLIDGDRMVGRVERVVDKDGIEVQEICDRCPGEMADRPMKGLLFITELRREGSRWVGGKVVSLESGWRRGLTGNCELEVKDGKLHFHGYRWLVGRREVWLPYEPVEKP